MKRLWETSGQFFKSHYLSMYLDRRLAPNQVNVYDDWVTYCMGGEL